MSKDAALARRAYHQGQPPLCPEPARTEPTSTRAQSALSHRPLRGYQSDFQNSPYSMLAPGAGSPIDRCPIVVVAIALTALVLGFFALGTVRNAPETFTAIVVIAAASVILGAVFRQERPKPDELGRHLDREVPRRPRGSA
jgi:hypothetical protein